MSKKSRSKNAQSDETKADLKRCRRALRSLDLVDSRLDPASWGRQVAKYVGEATVEQFFNIDGDDYTDVYEFTYRSFENAMHFSVGWRSWPLVAECEWMLPRLREALSRSDHAEPFLVEAGAGAGAAAAIISAALQVPVLALDSHPNTLGLPEQFAARTRGTVESRVADLADLATVLDGRIPAAVFGMGVYRHLQPHQHRKDSFSDWVTMKKILGDYQVGGHVTQFIEALSGADLVLSETLCPDYLAEMAAGLIRHRYEIPKGGIQRIDGATPEGPTVVYGIHFSTADLESRDANLLIEMCSPLPRPRAHFEADPDFAAEALRLSLEPTEFIEAAEVNYTDGSGRLRHEIFGMDDQLIGQYTSSTRGSRNLKFFSRRDLAPVVEAIHNDESGLAALGKATVTPIDLPAPQWGEPLGIVWGQGAV